MPSRHISAATPQRAGEGRQIPVRGRTVEQPRDPSSVTGSGGCPPPLPAHLAELNDASRRMIRSIEAHLRGPLIAYWGSAKSTLDSDDAEALRRLLLATRRSEVLHFSLTSSGGSGESVIRFAAALRSRCRRLVVHVPVQAQSAATMLTLAADEIRMAPCASLSPVDTTFCHPLLPLSDRGSCGLNQVDLATLRAPGRHRPGTIDGYQHLIPHIHPLSLASAVRGNSLSERLCHRLLAHHMPMGARRRRIVRELVLRYPSHQYPICLSEAREIGLPVTEMAETTETALIGLHDLHMHHGRIHREVIDPLHHRETTMRAIIGSAAGTVALVNDYAQEREKLGAEWFERWWQRGWMRLGVPSVPGGAERIGVEL